MNACNALQDTTRIKQEAAIYALKVARFVSLKRLVGPVHQDIIWINKAVHYVLMDVILVKKQLIALLVIHVFRSINMIYEGIIIQIISVLTVLMVVRLV